MALTVENGNGLSNANAYVSIADANDYFVNHGNPSTWESLTDAEKESAIRYATYMLDGQWIWAGEVRRVSQKLGWPRIGGYDSEGRAITETQVPTQVVAACCELALLHTETALNSTYARGGAVKREKIGSLETEYFEGARPDTHKPIVATILQGIGKSRSGASFNIDRV